MPAARADEYVQSLDLVAALGRTGWHGRFRLTEPRTRFPGTPEQVGAWSRRHRDLLWRLQARLVQVTRRPAEEIAADMRGDGTSTRARRSRTG